MEEASIQQVLKELKQTYPQYKISSLATRQRGNRHLIIVRGFKNTGDIDDWSINVVYPIWWNMMEILEKHEGAMRNFRLLFIRNNQFMLHSPNVGCGDAFREMKRPLRKEVYSDFERQHYIGECRNIADVLEYLTLTQIWY